ncbi:LysR family transcriptional regulator [Ferrimonas pelagia]
MTGIHSKVDLNLFRILLAVAQTGSTGAAAKQLHLTQSAVSHALGRLRQQLDDPLLVRQGRHLVLTPHGRDILPKVQASLEVLAQCHAQQGEFDPTRSDLEFHLGLRDILEAMLLPGLIHTLEQQDSPLRFTSTRVRGTQMEERLRRGALDLAVDLERPVSEQIVSASFRQEPLALLCGQLHPAYDAGHMDVRQYQASHHVLVTLEPTERSYVEQRMTGLQGKRHIRLHCETYFAAAQVAARSALVLTMPRSYGQQLAALLPLKVMPLPFACQPLSVRLYWRRANSEEPSIIWLRQQIAALS